MENRTVSSDDVQDVKEMTHKIQGCMHQIIKENDLCLGLSAIMNASINSILYHCHDVEEAVFYRNAFVHVFDKTIKTIEGGD